MQTLIGGSDSTPEFMMDDTGAATTSEKIRGLVGDSAGNLFFTTRNKVMEFSCNAPCPKGSYCPSQYRTMPCPAGRYGNRSGLVTNYCTGVCPRGSYCPAGTVTPIPCPPGSRCPGEGNVSPTPCEPGNYTFSYSRENCLQCPPGFLAPDRNSAVCDSTCAEGTFRKEYGGRTQADCTPCPAGKYMNARGAAACIDCDEGYASNATSATTKSVCTICSAGKFAPAASSVCSNCNAGTYSAFPGASSCTPCPLNTYSGIYGQAQPSLCKPCPSGTVTRDTGGAIAISQCFEEALACDNGTQPAQYGTAPPLYARFEPPTKCVTLVCPPPLELETGSSYCVGIPSPRYDFAQLLQQLAASAATGARHTAAVTAPAAASFVAACPLAIAAPPPPPAPAPSFASTYIVWIVYGAIMVAVTAVECALQLTHRTQVFDKLVAIDIFSSAHVYAVGTPITRYPTRLGGLCTTWAVSFLVAYAAFLIQAFQQSNTLTQQTLTLRDGNEWAAKPDWAFASPPWDRSKPASIRGLQVRLLVSGEPGACATPTWWNASGGGASNWKHDSESSCTTRIASQHVFSCEDCELDRQSAIRVLFDYSCQSMLLEALAVPAYPTGSISNTSAVLISTAVPGKRLTSVTWTVPPTLSLLFDNTTEAPVRKGYVVALQDAALTWETQALPLKLQPASAGVRVTIELPLQPVVSRTTLSPVTSITALLANLVGLMGLLNLFRVGFRLTEWLQPRVQQGLLRRRGLESTKGAAGGAPAGGGGGGAAGAGGAPSEGGAGGEGAGGGGEAGKGVQLRSPAEKGGAAPAVMVE